MAGYRNRKGTVAVQNFKDVLRLVWSYNGKRYYLYCGLADTPLNRIVAEGKAKLIEGDLATGNFDPSLSKYKPERQSQISAYELFEKFMERRSRLVDDRSLAKYKGLLAKLENHFGSKAAIAITESDAQKLCEKLAEKIQPITLRERISLIKACWDWGIKQKFVTFNPWTDIKIKVPPKQRPKPFTFEEIQQILSAFEQKFPHYADFVKFLFGTGVRSSPKTQ